MPAPFHPDQLAPGSVVGPWRVVASLGAGGFGRVFKVERGGRFFTMKMALRPAGPQASEEEDVNGRLSHEVAALLACAPHPNLPRIQAVDRWPDPPEGYLYFVTDYIDGETFHEWRWRVKPSAAHLLSVFTEVVRAVSDLHRRGLHHRDVKGDNLLIRRDDERPFLIDLGTVRMPGATTLTVGVAPASPHLLPPECVAFLREGQWEQGARFDAGIPGDLYALGALLYESLTDGYAFDPRLPYDRLLPAIETVTPRAPQAVNPKVPPALGDIALRLLAKRPEERYAGTEALLQALWEVAKEKRQPAWKVSLDRPPDPESPRDVDADTPRLRIVPELVRSIEHGPSADEVSEDSAPPPGGLEVAAVIPPGEASPVAAQAHVPEVAPPLSREPRAAPARRPRGRVLGVAATVLFIVGAVALGLARREQPPHPMQEVGTPSPLAEKGSPVVTSRSSPPANTPLSDSKPTPPRSMASPPERVVALTEAAPKPAAEPSPKKRGLGKVAAVACLAGAACAGSSSNLRTEPPERKACPPGAINQMAKLGFHTPWILSEGAFYVTEDGDLEPSLVPPEGPLTVYLPIRGLKHPDTLQPAIPQHTKFHGQIFPGRDRAYAWFTEMEFPDGSRYPVCVDLTWEGRSELGQPYHPSSTSERKLWGPRVILSTTQFLGR
ncbi:serine/threonine protein kinase [Myxococcus stipitatus DSM 14675]|uniref:non-specific serine/threonine protein kinase n=1 Tax=Myxococcus stipitatus (strain DSM 14675 / JCM 12634 / Mx s8) TaxID=1278073 RepID=L7U8G1_MYXSD|nr:serine/threonine-protein kinase [Myxococcus stipitatus]AGC44105.1 serine/threonine protein kinase [Myxococcus stipitatus DSM 14675]